MFELAYNPDTTPEPNRWEVAHVAAYPTGRWRDSWVWPEQMIKTLRLKGYAVYGDLSADKQSDRLRSARLGEELGLDAIVLDEQFARQTITVPQFREIVKSVSIPVYVVDVAGALNHQVVVNGLKPDAVYVELYHETYKREWSIINHRLFERRNINVIPCVNIGDTGRYSANHFREVLTWVYKEIHDEFPVLSDLWVWGWETGNLIWQVRAEQNYPIIAIVYKA